MKESYKLKMRSTVARALILAVAGAAVAGCGRNANEASGPIRQIGYLWRRDWSPAVVEAVSQAEARTDGIVVLGAEIVWAGGKPQVIDASIDWNRLSRLTKPVSVALRIAPYRGPFDEDSDAAHSIISTTGRLLKAAQENGVKLAAFQLDFDCAQKSLSGYRIWVGLVRSVVRPVPLIVTTLPSWLDEPEFARLIGEVEGYVLQVHSVPTGQSDRAMLCDTSLAQKWIEKANRLGVPFSVALPTYRCLAGYDETGKLVSVAMDGVEPVWPRGTRVVQFATNADQVAALVNDLKKKRPVLLRDLYWYRLPVTTDERNWRWPTLSAVMAGRAPLHKLEVRSQGENPVDLTIANVGEADEERDPTVKVTWNDGAVVTASDALPGWSVVVTKDSAIFKPDPGMQLRLSPGATRSIGWLRYDRASSFQAQVAESAMPSR